jgi:thiol-disulfide isomerase/thioredoxin
VSLSRSTTKPTGGPVRRRPALVGALAIVLLLGACGGSGTTAGETTAPRVMDSDVDVDTPELRKLREAAGMEPCEAPDRPAVEGGLPEITLPCLGGGEDVTMSALRGPLVVNLWASWCGPCRDELPYYQQLHERGRGKVDVLGVDYQDVMPGQALALAEETGVTYPSLADPGGELRAPFRVRGLPGVLLVDEDGTVVHREYVVVESYDQLARLVEEHLGVSVGTGG